MAQDIKQDDCEMNTSDSNPVPGIRAVFIAGFLGGNGFGVVGD
jgi:hypothetical protein